MIRMEYTAGIPVMKVVASEEMYEESFFRTMTGGGVSAFKTELWFANDYNLQFWQEKYSS